MRKKCCYETIKVRGGCFDRKSGFHYILGEHVNKNLTCVLIPLGRRDRRKTYSLYFVTRSPVLLLVGSKNDISAV